MNSDTLTGGRAKLQAWTQWGQVWSLPTERGTVDHPSALIYHLSVQSKPDEASQFPSFVCSELPLAFQDPVEKRKEVQGEDGVTNTL